MHSVLNFFALHIVIFSDKSLFTTPTPSSLEEGITKPIILFRLVVKSKVGNLSWGTL